MAISARININNCNYEFFGKIMLYLALGLFLVAAILGLVLLTNVLTNKTPPSNVILAHGILAVIGVLLVINYTLENDLDDPWLILAMFGLAILGGSILFTLQLRKKAIPKIMALVHPVVAAIAVISLIMYVLK